MDYRIYDTHVHIYPDKIAARASGAIGEFYDFNMAHNGSVEALLSQKDADKITGFVVSSSATTPHQVEAVNDFVISQCRLHDNFIGFGTIHHGYENYARELERVKNAGIRGIKIHHDFLKENIDAPEFIPIYKEIAKQDIFLLLHMGDDRFDYTHPKRLRHVKELVPDLKCIAAHFGGYRVWDESAPYLKDTDVYFDTSSSLFYLSPEKAASLIDLLGEDRFFFGSDYPMWQVSEEIERFMRLPIPESTRKKILYENFEKAFNIKKV